MSDTPASSSHYTDSDLDERCSREHCHHRRMYHFDGFRRCECIGCKCLTFIAPPIEIGDPQLAYTVPATTAEEQASMPPTFTLRAGKVTHYRALHALAGMLMEYGAPEEEVQEVVAAMNAFLVWHLRYGHDITKDTT